MKKFTKLLPLIMLKTNGFCTNVRSIDLHFEEMETLIESFEVKKPALVCRSETWIVESSAHDLNVLDNYSPMKFKPRKLEMKVWQYTFMNLPFEKIEFGSGIDFNYIAISCTN